MSFVISDSIQKLSPYIPGKPIEETQRELGLKKVVKLASNENPLGPSPKAVNALKASVKSLGLYPDSSAYRLKKKLVEYHARDVSGLQSKQLVIGNGSNELITLLVRTLCVPGDQVVTAQAAFVAYRICAQAQGVETVEVPVGDNLQPNWHDLVKAVRENARVKILFIANPNNPTGTYFRKDELQNLMREVSQIRNGSVAIVLDYAYWEYVTAKDLPSPFELLQSFPAQTVILKTFSKAYGLAGLRVGYAIGPADLMSHLEKIREPFNSNSLALVAAEAALSDTAFVARAKKVNEQGLKLWSRFLTEWGIPFWPSQGNFILANIGKKTGQSGVDFFNLCLKKGVILRPVANYGLLSAIRISIGTLEENRFAIRAVIDILKSQGFTPVSKSSLKKQGPIVAIDGPAGTGKSSATKRLAELLGFVHVDTGALYRSIALACKEKEIDLLGSFDPTEASRVARSAKIQFKRQPKKNPSNRVFLNGKDVTSKIREPEISMAASKVSAVPEVRAALLDLQRKLGGRGNSILEGRDIGTVIFPEAEVKFFLTASIEERVKRRLAELEAMGADTPSFEDLKQQMAQRDDADQNRAVAPLKKAEDAIEIDTTWMTLDQVVAQMQQVIRQCQ